MPSHFQEFANLKKLGDSLLTRSTKLSELISNIEIEIAEKSDTPEKKRAESPMPQNCGPSPFLINLEPMNQSVSHFQRLAFFSNYSRPPAPAQVREGPGEGHGNSSGPVRGNWGFEGGCLTFADCQRFSGFWDPWALNLFAIRTSRVNICNWNEFTF